MARIMVATNASADARVLHVAALRRAEAAKAGLAVVHVINGLDYDAQPAVMRQAIDNETEWLLHTMLALAEDRSGVQPVEVSIHIRHGDVADALVEFASTTRPEAILVGTPRATDGSEFTEATFSELLGRLDQAGIAVEQITPS